MQYQIIDLASWNRQEHYKFYPVMIHLITQVVNQIPAFEMSLKDEQLIEWETVLPLAIQIHHAVCDGFHVGKFIEQLQTYCDDLDF